MFSVGQKVKVKHMGFCGVVVDIGDEWVTVRHTEGLTMKFNIGALEAEETPKQEGKTMTKIFDEFVEFCKGKNLEPADAQRLAEAWARVVRVEEAQEFYRKSALMPEARERMRRKLYGNPSDDGAHHV